MQNPQEIAQQLNAALDRIAQVAATNPQQVQQAVQEAKQKVNEWVNQQQNPQGGSQGTQQTIHQPGQEQRGQR